MSRWWCVQVWWKGHLTRLCTLKWKRPYEDRRDLISETELEFIDPEIPDPWAHLGFISIRELPMARVSCKLQLCTMPCHHIGFNIGVYFGMS